MSMSQGPNGVEATGSMRLRFENGRLVGANGSTPGTSTTSTTTNATSTASTDTAATESSTPPGIRHPPPPVLADAMEEYSRTTTRLAPHQTRLVAIMREDPTFEGTPQAQESQTLYNSVSQILHFLSHAQHAISDIMVNLSQPPPRQLRARPFVIQSVVQSAVIQVILIWQN